MSVDIRVLQPQDLERWKLVEGIAFMEPPDQVERWAKHFHAEWGLGAFVDGEMQASASSVPFHLNLEGSNARMGGVTSVTCMPEFRRRGLVGQLLMETLKRSRDLGEPLSGLWTPHPALYRRYGWEVCSDVQKLAFAPKQVALRDPAQHGGSIARSSTLDWKSADLVYREWGRMRNSLLVRDETRWQLQIDVPGRVLDIYRNAAGDPEGYAILQPPSGPRPRTLEVVELLATTGEAYRALLTLVLSHDLVDTVSWLAGPDEPLQEVLADPGPITSELRWGLLLRIVNVPEALAARPAYGEGRLVFQLTDPVCPWNDGVWEVESRGHRLSAERCDDEPMLSLDACALAQLYNGYRSATTLARSGRLVAHHIRALAVADILFAMRTRPYCMDDF